MIPDCPWPCVPLVSDPAACPPFCRMLHPPYPLLKHRSRDLYPFSVTFSLVFFRLFLFIYQGPGLT